MRLPNWQWEEIRRKILERDNYTCNLCQRSATDVDHIKPICLGGDNSAKNLQSLCKDCHKRKTAEDREKKRRLDMIRNNWW